MKKRLSALRKYSKGCRIRDAHLQGRTKRSCICELESMRIDTRQERQKLNMHNCRLGSRNLARCQKLLCK